MASSFCAKIKFAFPLLDILPKKQKLFYGSPGRFEALSISPEKVSTIGTPHNWVGSIYFNLELRKPIFSPKNWNNPTLSADHDLDDVKRMGLMKSKMLYLVPLDWNRKSVKCWRTSSPMCIMCWWCGDAPLNLLSVMQQRFYLSINHGGWWMWNPSRIMQCFYIPIQLCELFKRFQLNSTLCVGYVIKLSE